MQFVDVVPPLLPELVPVVPVLLPLAPLDPAMLPELVLPLAVELAELPELLALDEVLLELPLLDVALLALELLELPWLPPELALDSEVVPVDVLKVEVVVAPVGVVVEALLELPGLLEPHPAMTSAPTQSTEGQVRNIDMDVDLQRPTAPRALRGLHPSRVSIRDGRSPAAHALLAELGARRRDRLRRAPPGRVAK